MTKPAQTNTHMIDHHFQCGNSPRVTFPNPMEDLLQTGSHNIFQDHLSALWNLSKEVLEIINRRLHVSARGCLAHANSRIRPRRIPPPRASKPAGIHRRRSISSTNLMNFICLLNPAAGNWGKNHDYVCRRFLAEHIIALMCSPGRDTMRSVYSGVSFFSKRGC